MRHILAVLIAGTLTAPTAIDGPPVRGTGTIQTWADFGRELRDLRQTLRAAMALLREDDWQPECRGYTPEKTVRCAALKQGVPVQQALSVWRCESGWGVEPPHSDPFHGPFQYLESTYASQQAAMPEFVEWFDLSPNVHDMRSNMLTAIGWASRNGWGPWSCA